jgi:hypothetical protein
MQDSTNAPVTSYITLSFNSDLIGVKTILTTVTPGHKATFSIDFQSSTVTTWTNICTTSTCVFGSNDLSGVDDARSTSFNSLLFTFTKGYDIVMCEVWAYSFKNYAPTALSFDFYYAPISGGTTYLDSYSYDAQTG